MSEVAAEHSIEIAMASALNGDGTGEGSVASSVPEDMEIGNAELDANKNEKMFTLKKWNAVAMWSWGRDNYAIEEIDI